METSSKPKKIAFTSRKKRKAVAINTGLSNINHYDLLSNTSMKKVAFTKEVESYLKKHFWKNSLEVHDLTNMIKEIDLKKSQKLLSTYFKNYPLVMPISGRITLTSFKRKFSTRAKILFIVEKSIKRNIMQKVVARSKTKRRSSIRATGLFNKIGKISPFEIFAKGERKYSENNDYDITELNSGEILNSEILKKYDISLVAEEDSKIFLFNLDDFKEKITQIDTEKEKKNILNSLFAFDIWGKFDYLSTEFKNEVFHRNHIIKKPGNNLDKTIYIVQNGSVKVSRRIVMNQINEKNCENFFEDKREYDRFKFYFTKLKSQLEKSVDVLYLCKGEVIGIEEFYESKNFRYDYEYKVDSKDARLFKLNCLTTQRLYSNSCKIMVENFKERRQKWENYFNKSIKNWIKQVMRTHYQFKLEKSIEKKFENFGKYHEMKNEKKTFYNYNFKREKKSKSQTCILKKRKKVKLKDLSLLPPKKKKNFNHNHYNEEMEKHRYNKTTNFLKQIITGIKNVKQSKKTADKNPKYMFKKAENNLTFFVTSVNHSRACRSDSSRTKMDKSVLNYYKAKKKSPMQINSIWKRKSQRAYDLTKVSSFDRFSTPKLHSGKKFHFLPSFGIERDTVSERKSNNLFTYRNSARPKLSASKSSRLLPFPITNEQKAVMYNINLNGKMMDSKKIKFSQQMMTSDIRSESDSD